MASAPRAFRRVTALGSFAKGRLQLYLDEMRLMGYMDRLSFVGRKLRSLPGLLAGRDKLDGIRPEWDALEVYRTNVLAGRRYRRRPMQGRLRAIDVFETNRPGRQPFDLRGFWDQAIHRHVVPGRDPGDMMLGENVQVVAAKLAERLRAACGDLECIQAGPPEALHAQTMAARSGHGG